MLSGFISVLLQILYFVNIIYAVIILFFERKNPAATWAWLLAIMLIPYFGFLFYLVLGLDSNRHKEFQLKVKEDEALFDSFIDMDAGFIQEQLAHISRKNVMRIPGAERLNDLVHLNAIAGSGAFSNNNKLTLFHEGQSKFKSLLQDIGGAKDFIHIQYYIVRNDELGRRIIEALAAKARQGVEVKFLIDGMGCQFNPKKFYEPLLTAGGQVCKFLPSHLVRVNFRNHRKLCVVDGKIGYIGGFNIGDEYIGKSKRFGFWRDSHIRIKGDSIKALELRFIMDWNFCAKEKITLEEKYFPVLPKKTGVSMQILSSGPDTKWPSVQQGYYKMIVEANKTIYMQTPYFVPNDSIFESLRVAALSGVDVRIIIPAHPDHLFVYGASLSYLGELLKAGVKCYQYEKGFIHSKLLLVDGLLTSVGTANMDVRSFSLNFEVNAFIYDKKATEEFEIEFLSDLKDCTRITEEWYAARPLPLKMKESVSRMLSPLL